MISEDVLSTEYLGQNKPVNNNRPLVSVVVITYNHSLYIKKCLDSILAQKTDFKIEIILGEDNSDDNTREFCKNYADKYPEIIRLFLRRPDQKIVVNGQKTFHFNFIESLNSSRGKYIALCEGDDYWTDKNKLQKQVDFLKANKEFSLVFSNGKIEYSDSDINSHSIYRKEKTKGNEYAAYKIPNEVTSINDLANGNYIHTAGILFRNWIKEEGIPSYLYEVSISDWPLHLYTTKNGLIKFINEDLFVYRIHVGGSISRITKREKAKLGIGMFNPILNSNKFSDGVKDIIQNQALKVYLSYLRHCTMDEDYDLIIENINSLNYKRDHFLFEILKNLADKNNKLITYNSSLKESIFFKIREQLSRIKRAIKIFS